MVGSAQFKRSRWDNYLKLSSVYFSKLPFYKNIKPVSKLTSDPVNTFADDFLFMFLEIEKAWHLGSSTAWIDYKLSLFV